MAGDLSLASVLEKQSKDIEKIAKEAVAGNRDAVIESLAGLLTALASGVPALGVVVSAGLAKILVRPADTILAQQVAAWRSEQAEGALVRRVAESTRALIEETAKAFEKATEGASDSLENLIGDAVHQLTRGHERIMARIESLLAAEARPVAMDAPEASISEQYDLFVSYARADSARVAPLVTALRAVGLKVWFDETDVADFQGITDAISRDLANAKALLAFYSAIYPTRRACQWELTAAFLAAQREGDPRRRVLVVNPEPRSDHLQPIELRDARFRTAPQPEDVVGFSELARAVAEVVAQLRGSFAGVRPLAAPPWYGAKGLGSNRFVGRIQAFWELHSALFANDAALITGAVAPGHVQVRGMGGIGKSLLAEEYALRFGAAFPGGVFVIRGTRDRGNQLSEFAARLGLAIKGRDAAWIEGRLDTTLREANQAYLWLVDDLPGSLSENDRRLWLAPNGLGKTLITTRSREYSSVGRTLDLGILDPEEAYQLLTVRRRPVGSTEEAAAHTLARELGFHALAIDVAGGAIDKLRGREGFAAFLERVQKAPLARRRSMRPIMET
jgi:hypothetical protein